MFRRIKILLRIVSSPRKIRQYIFWTNLDWCMPAPPEIKWAVLKRYGLGIDIWVETGTFRGDTTQMLSRIARKVVTIEPSGPLYEAALSRFAKVTNVEVLNGLSEDLLPGILREHPGPVALWLDGHFSGGVTYRGSLVSPILEELNAVSEFMETGGSGVVFVDDLRLFEGSEGNYPSRFELVTWAERAGAWWTIEHDIFIARFGVARQEGS